jgi:hypothetical protein
MNVLLDVLRMDYDRWISWHNGQWRLGEEGEAFGRRLPATLPARTRRCTCEVCEARVRFEAGRSRRPWAVLYRVARKLRGW